MSNRSISQAPGTLQARTVDDAKGIVDVARARGVVLRLLGGIAIKFHCPSASHRSLQREYLDLDVVGNRRQASLIERLLSDLGYKSNQRFNALHRESRLIYTDSVGRGSIDVFLDVFKMSHTIDLGERLTLDDYTIPITDLLLTKLQIVEANEKDIKDLIAILTDHKVENSIAQDEKETLDAGYIAKLCSNDWGLERTIILTLKKVTQHLPEYSGNREQVKLVQDRADSLRQIIEKGAKTLRWRLRAKLGESMRWYDLPEAPYEHPRQIMKASQNGDD